MTPAELFDAAIKASRLGMVAPYALSRMLRRVGVLHPERELTRERLRAALKEIDEVLRLYLTPSDAALARAALQELAGMDSSGSDASV